MKNESSFAEENLDDMPEKIEFLIFIPAIVNEAPFQNINKVIKIGGEYDLKRENII